MRLKPKLNKLLIIPGIAALSIVAIACSSAPEARPAAPQTAPAVAPAAPAPAAPGIAPAAPAAPQQPAAAAARDQIQQRQVIAKKRCRQTVPLDFQRDQCLEEPSGVLLVRDQIQVHKDRPASAPAPDVLDNLFDWFLQRLAAPGGRHHAK